MTKEENLYWLNKEIEGWENECQSKHPVKEALYAARRALEQEQRWIPVSERLPKEEQNSYWVCVDTGYQCECRWTNMNLFWRYETTDWHWNIADIPQYTKVVAWRPLPKSYKAESEE